MPNLVKLANASLVSVKQCPRWWVLAFFQVLAFFVMGRLARPPLASAPKLYWLAAAFVILPPLTVWLWLDMEPKTQGVVKQLSLKSFLKKIIGTTGVFFLGVAVLVIARILYPNWTFIALLSSLVAATCTLAVLYIVLFSQQFSAAWRLALDAWNKKISLAASVALVLIVAHGMTFIFVHGGWFSGFKSRQFSALGYSATILVLLAASAVIIAFLAAFLNCFLVLLFLDIVKGKKHQEAEAEAMTKVVLPQANFTKF